LTTPFGPPPAGRSAVTGQKRSARARVEAKSAPCESSWTAPRRSSSRSRSNRAATSVSSGEEIPAGAGFLASGPDIHRIVRGEPVSGGHARSAMPGRDRVAAWPPAERRRAPDPLLPPARHRARATPRRTLALWPPRRGSTDALGRRQSARASAARARHPPEHDEELGGAERGRHPRETPQRPAGGGEGGVRRG